MFSNHTKKILFLECIFKFEKKLLYIDTGSGQKTVLLITPFCFCKALFFVSVSGKVFKKWDRLDLPRTHFQLLQTYLRIGYGQDDDARMIFGSTVYFCPACINKCDKLLYNNYS